MHYLTLDTNTWIYLANGTEPVRLLTYIKQEVGKNNIKILLPEIIITEWERNKDKAVKQGGIKHYKDVTEALERIQKLLGEKGERDVLSFLLDEKDEKDYFIDFITNFKKKKKEVEEAISENIKLIEELFSHPTTEIIKIKDEIKIKAGQFALEKKAPFKEKNSFADALIVFSFIEYVKINKIEGALFITYNTDDFCEKKEGKKYLHPDLEPDFTETQSKFYTIVSEAINTIEKDIVSKEELELIEEMQEEAERDEHIAYCEICYEMNDRYNEVYFGKPVELYDERIELKPNPKQTELEFPEAMPEPTHIVTYDTLKVGHCDWCNTEHFECAGCGALNAIWDNDYNKKKECEGGCGLIYFIEREQDSDGIEEINYKILIGKETCEKCGNEYIDDGMNLGICPKCEDEYAYGD